MKKKVFRISSILIASVFILMAWSSGSDDSKIEESTKPQEKISCYVCGEDLTNEINKIEPMSTPGTWYCTPCYKSTMQDINDQLDIEGY
jgi:hypothetical protein